MDCRSGSGMTGQQVGDDGEGRVVRLWGLGLHFGLSVLEGSAMEGPGLGRRGREASLRNPTDFQVGSGADRGRLGVGRMPVYQWRSTAL